MTSRKWSFKDKFGIDPDKLEGIGFSLMEAIYGYEADKNTPDGPIEIWIEDSTYNEDCPSDYNPGISIRKGRDYDELEIYSFDIKPEYVDDFFARVKKAMDDVQLIRQIGSQEWRKRGDASDAQKELF